MPEIGQTFSQFRIIEKLGEGGMGEVFLAQDSSLDRKVALKFLPDVFSNDPERLARFEREAKLLASLNHPNIAAIHGLEEANGKRFLVMELVEGQTLQERLTARATGRSPLPLEEALDVCRQIAEGLEGAHGKGIIHRDLKPSNVKITPEGKLKILDFGLARALQPDADEADASRSPTITAGATRAGVILGTAAYMSPEQARGKTLDQRTDIWALGCLLYEMLAGRQAFQGETISDTLAAVLRAEPDWTALPPETSARLKDLVRRCLAKDANQRLHAVADVRLEIQAIASEPAIAVGMSGAGLAHRHAAWKPLVAAGAAGAALTALVIAGLLLSGVWPRAGGHGGQPLRVSIIHTEGSDVGAPAISPDGRRVAYGARRLDGMPVLWVRDLASGEARALNGTEGAYLPFWSPDSQELGFGAGGRMKRVAADGGPVQVVTNMATLGGGTWAPDSTIVFSRGDAPLYRVSAVPGSAATPATKLQSADWAHWWPNFLPDGRRFLFTAKLYTRAAEASEQGIYLGSLDSLEIRRLLPDLSSAVYAPSGYIVFVRDGTLTAAPFDLVTGDVGQPAPIGGSVAVDTVYYLSGLSAADGTIAVRPPPAVALMGGSGGGGTFNAELRLVDRGGTGKPVGTVQSFSYYMALNPDGRGAAVEIVDARASTSDLWLIDLQSGNKTPLTTTHGYAGAPVWSADGTRLAYAYQPPGQMDDVYIKDLRTGQATPVIQSPARFEHPIAWSNDGGYLLVNADDEQEGRSLFLWSFGSKSLTHFARLRVPEAAFSPDDRYVAFSSREPGRPFEVYVTTFPERRQTWQLTTEGGSVLSWRKDGQEILVATLSGHIVAYPVSTEGGFSVGQPTILVRDVGYAARFSTAMRDHSRILIRVSPDAAKDKGEIRLLFNWADALRQGKPPMPR